MSFVFLFFLGLLFDNFHYIVANSLFFFSIMSELKLFDLQVELEAAMAAQQFEKCVEINARIKVRRCLALLI